VLANVRGDEEETVEHLVHFFESAALSADIKKDLDQLRARLQNACLAGALEVNRLELLGALIAQAVAALHEGKPRMALEHCDDGLVWMCPDTIQAPPERLASSKCRLLCFRAMAHLALQLPEKALRDAAIANRIWTSACERLTAQRDRQLATEELDQLSLDREDIARVEAVCAAIAGKQEHAIDILERAVAKAPGQIASGGLLETYYSLAERAQEVQAVIGHARRAYIHGGRREMLVGFIAGEVRREQLLSAVPSGDTLEAREATALVCGVAATACFREGEVEEARRLWQRVVGTRYPGVPYFVAEWRLRTLKTSD
jgi:tetratricopeptide (TPR) repeat protein